MLVLSGVGDHFVQIELELHVVCRSSRDQMELVVLVAKQLDFWVRWQWASNSRDCQVGDLEAPNHNLYGG